MRYIIKLLFLLLTFGLSGQGNLIHNSGFEDNDPEEPNAPCKAGLVKLLQVWEEDAFYPNGCVYRTCDNGNLTNQASGDTWCTCLSCADFHTPDWWVTAGDKATLLETSDQPDPLNPGFLLYYEIPGHTGSGYVGLCKNELVEQKFFQSSPIVGGQTYVFSAYVRIPRPQKSFARATSCYPAISYDIPNDNMTTTSDIVLDVFLATQKIKYSDNNFLTCNSSGSTGFKDLTTNHITKIKTFHLNLVNQPFYSWHKISFEFVCPSNHNYDWIGFEVNEAESADEQVYILIDDVSIIKKCELGCTPTSGIPSPLIASYPAGGPYAMGGVVSNIQNVKTVKIEVFSLLGGLPLRTQYFHNTNGFSGPVFWDGWTDGGAPTAVGVYVLKVTCTNDCGDFQFSANVYNPGCATLPIDPRQPSSVYSEVRYNDCCEHDFYLNNKTFTTPNYSPYFYNFRPINNIYFDNCIVAPNASQVNLVAGNEILITGETSVRPATSDFQARIEACPGYRPLNDEYVLTDKDFVFYDANSNLQDVSISALNSHGNGSISITVFPNPSETGLFEVKTANGRVINQLRVYSAAGVLILDIEGPTTKVDLSNVGKGLYILEVYTENNVRRQKIIYN